jgi:hypothetical protein
MQQAQILETRQPATERQHFVICMRDHNGHRIGDRCARRQARI